RRSTAWSRCRTAARPGCGPASSSTCGSWAATSTTSTARSSTPGSPLASPLGLLTRTFPSVGTHMAALDGLRGLALLLVVASHGSNMGLHFVPGVDMSGTGKTGVWLFFVLSAFLLMHQFLQLDAQGRLDAGEWWRYAWRRVLRIYPLYTVFLLACWLLPLQHQMPPMSAREV